jgi:hypothetical protein
MSRVALALFVGCLGVWRYCTALSLFISIAVYQMVLQCPPKIIDTFKLREYEQVHDEALSTQD